MLHNNVLEKKNGFRGLTELELDSVGGGTVLHIDGDAALTPWVESSGYGSAARAGFEAAVNAAPALFDYFFGDSEEEMRHQERMQELENEQNRDELDADGQEQRDCRDSGGDYSRSTTTTTTTTEGSVGVGARGATVSGGGSETTTTTTTTSTCTGG